MCKLDEAIEILGGVKNVADTFELTSMAIQQWKTRGVPVKHCVTLERLTERKITCGDLRPDIFGDPSNTSIAV